MSAKPAQPAHDPFAIPIDVQNFLNALLLVAAREDDGFGVHEIARIEEAWQIVDADIASHGFVLALEGGAGGVNWYRPNGIAVYLAAERRERRSRS